MSRLAGRCYFVTGAGHGIGRAIVLRLTNCGARVVAGDKDEEAVVEVAAEANTIACKAQSGGECTSCLVDVSDASAVDRAVAFAIETYGRLDGAVNCAGTNAWCLCAAVPLPRFRFGSIVLHLGWLFFPFTRLRTSCFTSSRFAFTSSQDT